MSGKSKSGKPIRVGIAGLGTVGAGVIKILTAQAELLSTRAGCPIVIGGVSARSKDQDRGVDLSPYQWFDDCLDMANADDIDVV
ncbi:MAG: homoserine dehydrogenase, partial [Pseudomonadota bacterium]